MLAASVASRRARGPFGFDVPRRGRQRAACGLRPRNWPPRPWSRRCSARTPAALRAGSSGRRRTAWREVVQPVLDGDFVAAGAGLARAVCCRERSRCEKDSVGSLTAPSMANSAPLRRDKEPLRYGMNDVGLGPRAAVGDAHRDRTLGAQAAGTGQARDLHGQAARLASQFARARADGQFRAAARLRGRREFDGLRLDGFRSGRAAAPACWSGPMVRRRRLRPTPGRDRRPAAGDADRPRRRA